MSSNDKKKLQETKRISSFVPLSSDKLDIPRKSIDPSTEIAEPHLLLEENSFPTNSIIAKDDDIKRINNLIEAIHVDTFKKEEQQPQKSSFDIITAIKTQPSPDEIINSITSEQHTRRTVTFDDDKISSQSISNQPIHTSYVNLRLSNHDSIPNDQQEKEPVNILYSSDTVVGSNQISLTTQDLNSLFSEDEYIPGGFANLGHELEEELLNDFADEFDDQTTRHNRYIPSIPSSDHIINITRSPIELWQRARILIAVHLYKIQNKAFNLHRNTFPIPMVNDPSMIKAIDNNRLSNSIGQFNYLEKLFEQKDNIEEQKIIFGLSIIQQFSLNSSQQYQRVDFYDVEQGYIIMCNVINLNNSEFNTTNHLNPRQLQSYNKSNDKKCKTSKPILTSERDSSLTQTNKLLVYPINKNLSNKIQSVEFDCPFQFDFMLCIPIFRLILAFINIKNQKSLMILIGDASRKCIFLSKQQISYHIYSILYIHETSMLFLGCMGRVLLYNTQPLQFTSQPLFISELTQLPFQSNEPIIHICHIIKYQSIGILSNRYFVIWEYISNKYLLMKFCNPYRYDFIRCHYNLKYDYIIFAFIDGFILIYQINHMKQIRRYKYHWKMITDLKTSKDFNLLLSSSIDYLINIWNFETLQHIYQYNTYEEIIQIDSIHENLFYYHTLKHFIIFKLNLNLLLFSITKINVKSLKLFTNMQQTERIIALLEDYSSIIISPVSGSCLTYIPNITKKPIKQILHDISRSNIYSLQFNGEIILYHTYNNPCIAEYKIQIKSEQYAITCMTLINPIHTHLFDINSKQNSIEKSLIFFGHANGYISLFQGDSFIMKPILAHKNSIICLETSRSSMKISNILFTNCEVILSSSIDNIIYIWNLIRNKLDESIQLIHILTIEQEKNISFKEIKFLSMIDNFIIANYSDQNYLHIWQLVNISIQINNHNQWGIVEHPTKGNHHHGQIQAISATLKLKLFASSDTEGCIKIWDHTNSLLRDIYLDKTLYAIEFLSENNELIIAYQNNIYLILPEYYLLNYKKFKLKQQIIIAEDKLLEIIQPFNISYQSLPIFNYKIKTHHIKKRLQKFQRQLTGHFAIIESDNSQSDNENSQPLNTDHLSIISDDSDWSALTEDVKDILRMKKYQIRQQNK